MVGSRASSCFSIPRCSSVASGAAPSIKDNVASTVTGALRVAASR